MTDRPSPDISSRKAPQQARSNELVASILEAAIQVLQKEGAQRFTTARVAERAGVSVGSLYQYFPNKAAILFRLQTDEWQRTANLLADILSNTNTEPLRRLRLLVHAFLRSECEEAQMRVALHDAAPLYRDAPQAHQVKGRSWGIVERFLAEALPNSAPHIRQLANDLISDTLGAVAKQYSTKPRTESALITYADALADMLCGYLQGLQQRENSAA
ncbi:TetR family transcriptional regulator [Gallaecimonas mangrovi]|uniref:TetR family transcriptional regulator n=1 Tax=Gallaecimonas mangrovi TaxID=2291597 RepID=UPI000E200F7D|nr:TetR family transcriptional regulator [Gallaecimonas mangrovi]